ncbi:MAG TPA: tetratricopeptide repeat protein [Bacteroidia bacterium]|nr:tetratricopeptide repeat protein [Bacteroidia bacterium]HNT79116.1 tetratricopeptide repeat protein [Bacteroidia bacterium]
MHQLNGMCASIRIGVIRFFIGVLLLTSASSKAVELYFLDSTLQVLKQTQVDSVKLNCLYTLSFEYGFLAPDTALKYGHECLQLALKNKDTVYMFNAYNAMGNAYESMSKFDEARYCHYQSYRLALLSKKYNKISTSLNNIAITLKEQGQYKEALNLYLKTLTYMNRTGNLGMRMYFYIAELYLELGNVAEAKRYTELGNTLIASDTYGYLHPLYQINVGRCMYHEGKIDSAIIVLQQAADRFKDQSEQLNYAICLRSLGDIFYEESRYEEALNKFLEERLIQISLKNGNGICLSNINCALSLYKVNPKERFKIDKYLNEGLQYLYAIKANKEKLKETFRRIAKLFEERSEHAKALEFYQHYSRLNDSLLNVEKYRQINELQIQYETLNKEKTIAKQQADLIKEQTLVERKSDQIIILTLIVVLIVIASGWFYQSNSAKQKLEFAINLEKEKKENELKRLASEFKERERISKDLHDEIGAGLSKLSLLSGQFQNSPDLNISQKKQLRSFSTVSQQLSNNLRDLVWALNPSNNTLDNLIYRMHEHANDFMDGLNIKFSMNIPETIEEKKITKEVQRNIIMTFKEALNNAVKHAKADVIQVSIKTEQNLLSISVSDNGIGCEIDKVKSSGNGLRNMEQRIADIGGKWNINSNSEGTQIAISVPV